MLPCPVNELVPTADGTLYARSCGKLWRSSDQGRSWRELSAVPGSVIDIAVDPSRPNAIYVAASLKGLHRSIDRGETWVDITADPDHDFRSLLVDPAALATIYAGDRRLTPQTSTISAPRISVNTCAASLPVFSSSEVTLVGTRRLR